MTGEKSFTRDGSFLKQIFESDLNWVQNDNLLTVLKQS
jgi:hypothetical protein